MPTKGSGTAGSTSHSSSGLSRLSLLSPIFSLPSSNISSLFSPLLSSLFRGQCVALPSLLSPSSLLIFYLSALSFFLSSLLSTHYSLPFTLYPLLSTLYSLNCGQCVALHPFPLLSLLSPRFSSLLSPFTSVRRTPLLSPLPLLSLPSSQLSSLFSLLSSLSPLPRALAAAV